MNIIQDLSNAMQLKLLEFKDKNKEDIECSKYLELSYDLLENQIRLSCGNTKLMFIRYFEKKGLLFFESVVKLENSMTFPNTVVYEVSEDKIYNYLHVCTNTLDKVLERIRRISRLVTLDENLQCTERLSKELEMCCGYKSNGAFCDVIMKHGYMDNDILKIPARCSGILDCEISIKLKKDVQDMNKSESFK